MNENRKPAGRPKAANPLAFDTKVRLTKDDAQRLDDYCERHNTRRALAIRTAILRMLDDDDQTGTEK